MLNIRAVIMVLSCIIKTIYDNYQGLKSDIVIRLLL